MLRRLALLLLLSGCAVRNHAPPFANVPYEPFSRSAAVAVAMDEWRLWGNRVDDNGGAGYVQTDATMGERQPGLWQRVGEYWWEGMNAGDPTSRWTGMHDGAGHVFPVPENGQYAWSAAFISYVMRIAGAGPDFPYGADHATYINAAARHQAHGLLDAEDPASYAPRLGDLACFPRDEASSLTFADLPTITRSTSPRCIICPPALSVMTVCGTPCLPSSQAVSEAPWLRGRVSSTQTCTSMPESCAI